MSNSSVPREGKNRNRFGRMCACCTHPRRSDIDDGLIRGTALRALSKEFGISAAAILRHRDLHLKIPTQAYKRLDEAHAASELAGIKSQLPSREDVGGALMNAVSKLEELIDRNLTVNDSTALSGFGEARKTLETLSRLAGHLSPNAQQINVKVGISVEGLGAELAKQMAVLQTLPALDTRQIIEATAVRDD